MNPRLARAAEAQRSAIQMAVAIGDLAEETARRRTLGDLERRERSSEALSVATAQNFAQLVRAMDPRDGLRRLIVRGDSGIGFEHLRAAFALRDHVNGGASCAAEQMERVDGGTVHNGQMEAMMDRRRPLRYALDAARDAVEDRKLMPVAIRIAVYGDTPRGACDSLGVTWGGQMAPRICAAIVEALDAAAAHIGVSR
jgi:hypothetical protein